MFSKRFLGVLRRKKEVDKNLRMMAEKSWSESWWLRIGTSVSRYLRKLGLKKALQGRLGPLLQLSGFLIWWTRFWIIPLVKGIDLWMLTESQLHLYLWLRASISSCSITRMCVCVYRCIAVWDVQWVVLQGILDRGGQKNWLLLMFGPWERGGEAHLLPSAKVLGSQGAASCWTFW